MIRVWRISLILLCIIFSGQAQVTGLEGWDIFLDPGHSRKENMGIHGYSEAEKNVRVGLQLRDLLLSTTDIDTVYLSRSNDQQVVGLYERSQMANALEATWFHSLHSNAGAPAANSTLLLWGQYYNGNEKVPNGGKAMSDIMVDILTRGMRTYTSGSIGDCSFYTWSSWCQESGGPYLSVNRNTTMPSELSESGFHTNSRQNQLNINDEWKRLEAYTFYWSILKFRGIDRPSVGIVAGIVSNFETDMPINGATISINEQSYTTDTFESVFYKYTTEPDQLHNGFYYIEDLPNTELEMIVSAPGYYSDTLQVAVIDTFFTFQDVQLLSSRPPFVKASFPADGDTSYRAYDDIVIDFSRTMNTASVESAFNISPATAGIINWSRNETRIKFIPDSLEFLTDYTITISAEARDDYDHPLDGNNDGIAGDDFIVNFRTGSSDVFPPEVVHAYPANGDTGIVINPLIRITYDEPLKQESVDDQLFNLYAMHDFSSIDGILKHYVVNGQSVLNFFPQTPLENLKSYAVIIDAGFEDLQGNVVTLARMFAFTAGDYDYSTGIIDDFEGSNVMSNWWQPQISGTTKGIVTDSTSKDTSTQYINHLNSGTTSMKIQYGWDIHTDSWLIRIFMGGEVPRAVTFDKNQILQAYVFGDGSGNLFRFTVDDRVPVADAANHEVSPWYALDWIGWKLISWNMTKDGTGSWLGDGNLDGTLRFDSIQLSYQPGKMSFGTIYIDDLHLAQKITSSLESAETLVPKEFFLNQNYPNPFNPITIIEYGLPLSSPVRIDVYDLTGRLCKTLVNETKQAGLHSVKLDGSELASGVYVYTIQAKNVRLSKKLVLLK